MEHFQECAKEDEQYITKLKASMLRKAIQKKINSLSSELIAGERSKNASVTETMKWIGKVEMRADDLLEEINEEDNDTGELNDLKDIVSKIKERTKAFEATIEASLKQPENERELKHRCGNECIPCNPSAELIPSQLSCSKKRLFYFHQASQEMETRRNRSSFGGGLTGAASCILGGALAVGSGGLLAPVGAGLIGSGMAAMATEADRGDYRRVRTIETTIASMDI